MKEIVKQYKQLLVDQQAEANKMPIFWAFDEEQFDEGLKKYNEEYPETKGQKIYAFGYGGYGTHEHLTQILEMLKRHSEERNKLLENDDVLYYAFKYELGNHEYIYSEDEDEVTNAVFDKDYTEMTDREKKIFHKAEKDYMQAMDNFFNGM